MKPLILAASISLVLAGVAGEAAAACPGATQVTNSTNPTLLNLLKNNTVCVKVKPPGSGWDWQEQHIAVSATGGTLVDYKKGPNDPVDKSEEVGTWAVSRAATVTHSYYGSGGTYTYTVFSDSANGTHSFCDAANKEIVAKIQRGTGAPCNTF